MVQEDAWNPPSVPLSFTSISIESTLCRASDAWRAGHELLWVIAELDRWVFNQARDLNVGDRIIKTGRIAMRALFDLKINCEAFMAADIDHLLRHWPTPPSELLDPAWYEDPNNRKRILEQRFYRREIFRPAIEEFLHQLQEYPDTALIKLVPPSQKRQVTWDEATEDRNKWIYNEVMKGTAYETIALLLKKKPKTWDRIDSKNGVKAVAQRYANAYGLEKPRSRQPGRPPH